MKNSNTVYMSGGTGASGCVMKSTNGGLNWTVQSTSGLTGITSMDILQNGNTIYGYAICADGSVLKINETITGVENPSTIVPDNYSLEQNFPNPFNPTTTINYSLPVATDVSLKVYDALGNEVMSLVNGFKNAGTHSITMNASELTSGIYFYKLQAGNFVSTKKLTLIK
ncbi:MAG: T9SS type A sorting domain-containing protein [Bacteroidetes bacterium]|nr:T9SS type A sorting domain-containing protein [Bacteroidota bacterium]